MIHFALFCVWKEPAPEAESESPDPDQESESDPDPESESDPDPDPEAEPALTRLGAYNAVGPPDGLTYLKESRHSRNLVRTINVFLAFFRL